nr:MAG TPA: hypothetical protein [Caudoviricetes sp.]
MIEGRHHFYRIYIFEEILYIISSKFCILKNP